MGWLLARFIAVYGMGALYAPLWREQYGTKDGCIPFKLFVLLSSAIRHLAAEDELRQAHATAYGTALPMAGKHDGPLKKHRRRLVRLAFPEE